MEEKQFDPARQNTTSPAPGMAAVNTHNPGEESHTEEDGKVERVITGKQDEDAQKDAGKADKERQGAD